MTVRNIELYPTCDVHLLLEGPGAPTAYQLEVRDLERTQDNLSGLVARTAYTDIDPAIATVSATGLISPVAVGETLCRIRHTDADPAPPREVFVSEIIVRIRVHRRLETLWLGNNRVTVFKDESNYVLSVYGAFEDGTIGDISSHPYLTFSSADATKVEVDNAGDRGRVTGKAVTGGNPVKIKVAFAALSDEIDAFVAPPLSTLRRILERIHGAGPVGERRNILFLSEGFTAAQQPLFRRIVTLLKDELFASRLNSPYDQLKDRFNVWMGFDPSGEEGTTAGEFVVKTGTGLLGVDIAEPLSRISESPAIPDNFSLRELVLRVGLPDRYHPIPTTRAAAEAAWASTVAGTDFSAAKLENDVVAAWLTKLASYHLLQARDSLLGLMNGARYGDRDHRRVDPAAPRESVMHWYQPSDVPHSLHADRRRMARDWNPSTFRNKYLASLRPTGSNSSISDVWVAGGADRDLVIFLVNSAYDGGARSAVGLGISTRQNGRYTQVHVAGNKADHSLPDLDVLSLPALLGSSLDEMVSVLAHELAHVFGMGDEYEGQSYSGTHDVLVATDVAGRRAIEGWNNLVHHYTIEVAAGGHGIINMARVKWKLWHRIERCSVLTEDPVALGGGRLRIRVRAGDRAKWDTDNMHNIEVYLRSRSINGDAVNQPAPAPRWFLEGPLKILEIEADGSLVLASTFVDGFRKDDVLYQPQVEDGKPLTVFHPTVLFNLETLAEPFAMKTDASEANTEPAYPPEHALVPDLNPRFPAYVVGVYEGGGTYNTRVYRASGLCKMRQSGRANVREKPLRLEDHGAVVEPEGAVIRFVPFCYVCRYIMANTLDPASLERLPYPE